MQKEIGRIIKLTDKGFGLIARGREGRYIMAYSFQAANVLTPDWKDLREGMIVEYDTTTTIRGNEAVNVVAIN
ncbi:cold-shock protein [Parasporobacterium paucivorans]|uniref:Cold shock protein, CspA family n=1 Tax=Parasporobacterium paucivorans DSM 15970 TaxID=1122934 RepID=A0A1M6F3A3_9FIRM|nr:cold shock domain-containing protein [Parasporobacterium paucivorans]SHI92162.1 Cold shock protein, CspA family [Parasporobacterium paucivorans DSM 15970]